MLNFCILKKTPPSAVPTAPSNGEVAAVQSRICKQSSGAVIRRPARTSASLCFCYLCVCVCVQETAGVQTPGWAASWRIQGMHLIDNE